MNRRSLGILGLLAGLLVGFAQPATAEVTATAVRIGQSAAAAGGDTRLVLDLTAPVAFSYFMLANPYRVVVDLPAVRWRLPADAGRHGSGLIQDFRYGHFRADSSRLVLDVIGPVEVGGVYLLPPRDGAPDRLMVDIRPVTPARFNELLAQSPPPQAAPLLRSPPPRNLAAPAPAVAETPAAPMATTAAVIVPAPPPTARATRSGRRLVVIDPGHGGVDPGAIGVSGAYEKDITLAVSREIRRRLLATNRYQVEMTRDSDVFVPLGDRVKFARDAHADLFISIHADIVANAAIRGGTVYTLSQTGSDKAAEALAAKENKADIIGGVDLGNESNDVASILIDLAQRETMNHSAQLAQIMVEEMQHHVAMNERGHRFAGFRVLKAPDIPSVLFEIGYLSNKQDEALMRSSQGREKISAGVVAAVGQYFASIRK